VLRFCLCLLFCPGALLAQPADSPANAAIQSAIDRARAVPAEFAADAMLRIAALPSLDAARRISLIEEAFHRAAEAQQPFKRRSAMPQLTSNIGFQQRAYAQNLDALSLRTRAVQEMLPLDPAKARLLFLAIPLLHLPAVGCQEVLVFDAAGYYQALSEVARRAFTAQQLAAGEAFQLVRQRLALLSSPAEIAPAARAIAASGLPEAEFAGALAAFLPALKKIAGDDRSFTFYLPEAGAAVQTLIAGMPSRGASPLPLIEAYRLYLVQNLAAPRCADDDVMEGSEGSASGAALDARAATAIRFFNQSVRQPPLQTIQPSEVAATGNAGVASGMRSCESPECAAIASQYRALIFNLTGGPLPTAARDSDEWQGRFEDALAALRAWPDQTEDAAPLERAQQFREKCAFFTDLANLPRDARLRQLTLRAMLDYLRRNRDRAPSRLEWLLPVNVLIGRMSLDPQGLGALADDFRRSSDPVIAMYARLELLAPRAPADVFALM
jgi:hypothetical protein